MIERVVFPESDRQVEIRAGRVARFHRMVSNEGSQRLGEQVLPGKIE